VSVNYRKLQYDDDDDDDDEEYLNSIPRKHDIKEVQKTATRSTTLIRR
jgi:hypothetical protein